MDAKISGANLHNNGPDEVEFLSFILARMQSSRAQLFQDLWVLFETRCKKSGYFVEFGACDGLQSSNTYLLERAFGWRGIVAEPNPVFANALYANRRCYISTLCVARRSGDTLQFNQTSNPILATISAYSASDFHASERENGQPIEVQTISLNDLLTEAGAPNVVDFLSIDTEGSEFDILSEFDFKRYDVNLICVEHNFAPRRDDLHHLLSAYGYQRKFVEHTRFDDWYLKLRG
jgi:FkbM family methyltransferase